MADLTSSTLATNYRVAKNPFSKFGTRELMFLKVTGLTGVGTNSELANSLFAKAIRGAQQMAEIYFVSAPSADVFVMAVAADTLPTADTKSGSEESGSGFGLFEAAINAATGGTVTVSTATIS